MQALLMKKRFSHIEKELMEAQILLSHTQTESSKLRLYNEILQTEKETLKTKLNNISFFQEKFVKNSSPLSAPNSSPQKLSTPITIHFKPPNRRTPVKEC
jgi:hypothetical protein